MRMYRLPGIVCLCGVAAFAQVRANLVPNPEFRVDSTGKPLAWRFWSPRADLRPRAEVVKDAEGAELRLAAVDFSSFGKWMAGDIPIHAGRFYRFEVFYKPTGIVNERGSVGVMLTWSGLDGTPVQRDYVDGISTAEDGWRKASRTLRAPQKSVHVTVELWLRWTKNGAVIFRNPHLAEISEPPQRKVRVVTTRLPQRGGVTVQDNLDLMAKTLDEAGRERPDVVLLTETFPENGVKGTLHDRSEPIPGPVTDALGRKAREYHTYIIAGMLELDGDKSYNTAVLIDRQGRIAGRYRKTHLPLAEVEDGETPGDDYPVFDTDFGRIGILICWDLNFPETSRIMRLKGAEILFAPTAGDPGPRHFDVEQRARALDNGLYVVTAVGGESASRIINPDGEVIAETMNGLATGVIDLNSVSHLWWESVGPADGELKSLVIQERRPETYTPLVESRP